MCPICGGNWNNSSNAGVWALNLNNSRANSNDNVGFRSDSALPRTQQRDGGAKGGVFLRRASVAKSAATPHPSSAIGAERLKGAP